MIAWVELPASEKDAISPGYWKKEWTCDYLLKKEGKMPHCDDCTVREACNIRKQVKEFEGRKGVTLSIDKCDREQEKKKRGKKYD